MLLDPSIRLEDCLGGSTATGDAKILWGEWDAWDFLPDSGVLQLVRIQGVEDDRVRAPRMRVGSSQVSVALSVGKDEYWLISYL